MPLQNRSKVPIGTVLEGKYRITGELGRGGMATVYEAENVDIGKRVAVKVLAAELVTSRIVRERFIREARAAAAIRSPYICDVYDSGMFEERPFLVMELLEGESLYDRMTRVRRIDIQTTLRVITLTARGLGKAHQAGVVHRDMKPENIFLLKNEEGELTVKIVDFGLAKFYEPTGGDTSEARLTRQGALFGTPAYMSPEQAKGQGEVDHRADLWALGCITYECLTGRTVWKVDQGVAMILAQIASAPLPRPSTMCKDVPEAFDRWFFKALDRDINRRFQTAKKFVEALNQAFAPRSSSVSDAEPTSAPSSPEPARVAADTDPVGEPADSALDSQPLSTPGPVDSHDSLETTPSPALPPSAVEPRPRSGHAVATLVATAIVVLTGYALWLYVLHPPEPRPVVALEQDKPDAEPDGPDKRELRPVEREPYALQIGAAQQWLSRGNLDNAVKMFKEAYTNGGSGVARALLYHAALAQEVQQGRCRMTGLGRPRPFDVTVPSSRPTLAVTEVGAVVVWVDDHQARRKWQGISTVLDSSLRRVGPALVVTPEVRKARSPQLVRAGDKLVLAYGVRGSPDGGAYVRLLELDGRIAGRARRIAQVEEHRINPIVAPTGSGSYWVVWEQELENDVQDLMMRHLNAELEPLGQPLRVTAYVPEKRETVGVADAVVAVAHQHLYLVYVQQKDKETQVMLQRIALSDPALKTGLVDEENEADAPGKKSKPKRGRGKKPERRDRALGRVQPISTEEGKNAQPRIACVEEGCFVVWDNERGGALAAFIDGATGEKLWHRDFSARGSRPNAAASEEGTMVAWYDGGRVKLAAITRDGLGEPSVLARVKGYQPDPEIVAGPERGQWYIAWRDYEAGHYEAFVVRAQCQ